MTASACASGPMLLIACPWCGPRDEVEFRYGGQADVAYPPTPTRSTTRRGPPTCSSATTRRAPFARALGPRRRLPALVQRGPRHGHPRHRPDVPAGRLVMSRSRTASRPAAPASTARRPVRFTFDGAAYEGFAGDTLASALLANGVAIVGRGHLQRPAARRLHRRDRGAERARPGRLAERRVGADAARDDRRDRGRTAGDVARWQGPARVDATDDAGFDKRFAHVEVLVVGGGRGRRRAARRCGQRASRRSCPPRRPRRRPSTPIDGVRDPRPHDRDRRLRPRLRGPRRAPTGASNGGPPLARPGEADRARHRRDRAADRLRRQRPTRDHARERGRRLPRAVRRPARPSRRRLHDERLRARGRRYARRSRRRDRRGRRPAHSRPRHRDGGRRGRPPRPRSSSTAGASRPTCCSCRAAGTRTCALWSQARGRLRFDDDTQRLRPGRHAAERRGRRRRCGRRACRGPARSGSSSPRTATTARATSSTSSATRPSPTSGGRSAPASTSIEHVKRYTTIGTASDQGKTSGVNASAVAATLLGQEPGAARRADVPPAVHAGVASRCSPVATAATSTTRSGRRPIHDVARRPTARCSRTSASGSGRASSRATASPWTRRSCASAARPGRPSAVMDASTLGKIDLQGPDAGVVPRPRLHEHASRRSRSGRAATA